MVHLRNQVKNDGNRAPGFTYAIATLPVGYRPPTQVTYWVPGNGGTNPCFLDILATGAIHYGGTAIPLNCYIGMFCSFGT